MEHPIVTITEQGIIHSTSDFVRLNIVDWKRFSPYWNSEQQVMDTLSTWFVGRFDYTIAKVNLSQYPDRNDFPGWEHTGDHESIGRLFWNHFKYVFEGELRFHDSPDFSGVIHHRDRIPQERRFYGDVGKVSPIAMRDTLRSLSPYSLWISVIDEYTQVILKRLVPKDPDMTFFLNRGKGKYWTERLVSNREQIQADKLAQLTMF